MFSFLSPRRSAAAPPASPPFFALRVLASPEPRRTRRAVASPELPRAAQRRGRLRRLLSLLLQFVWLLVPRGVLPFAAGALAATLLLEHGDGRPSEGGELAQALSATRAALLAWHAAFAPSLRALLSAATAAAASVPPEAYALSVCAALGLAALWRAWRALSAAVACVCRAASRHGSTLHASLARRSRSAASLAPHALTLGGLTLLLAGLPGAALEALSSRTSLAVLTLALPGCCSLLALRSSSPGPASVTAWLRYWCAVAPALAALELPLLRLAQLSRPARCAWLLLLGWLAAPWTRGAEALSELLAPRLAPLAGRLGEGRLGRGAHSLLSLLAARGYLPAPLAASCAHALRHCTPALLLCTAALLAPGVALLLATPLAQLLCPCAARLAALRHGRGADGAAFQRGALTYWAVHGVAAALAAAPSVQQLILWLPMRRRLRLAAVLHLQLLGGAPRVAQIAVRVLAGAAGALRKGLEQHAVRAQGSGQEPGDPDQDWRPRTGDMPLEAQGTLRRRARAEEPHAAAAAQLKRE